MLRVLIADDHPILRRGLRAVLEEGGTFEVVAEAADGLEAIERIRQHQPDVAVIDVSMPKLDGLEVLAQAHTWPCRPAFVVLTMHDEYVGRVLALGGMGYLLKEDASREIADCVAAAAAGRRYLSRSLPTDVAGHASPRASMLAKLSAAELRVLGLLAQHKTSREIAALLCVSHRTVQNHRASMCRKLELRGSQALLRLAIDYRDALRRG